MPDFARSRPTSPGAAAALLAAGWMIATASAGPVPAAGEPKPGNDASALVRSIREQEAWIDRVESLRLKADIRFETSPAGIAKRRRELRKKFGDGRDIESNRSLRPVAFETIELAFDRERVRWWDRWDADWFDLRVWDGRRLITYASYGVPPDRREYQILAEPGTLLSGLLVHFDSFRAGPRRLWWVDTPGDREVVARLMGRPEDFVYGGRETFHGTDCHVASCWANWTTFYIAVADGRLRGARHGALRSPEKRLLNWMNRNGHSLRNVEEMAAWIQSRAPNDARAFERDRSANMHRLVDPVFDYWLSDDREIAPGCRLPMTQESNLYFLDEDDRLAIEETHRLTVTEAKVNIPLPAELFRVEIPAGARVIDRTKDAPAARPR